MPETSGTGWYQLKVADRHGTQAFGQSSDGTGDDGNLAAFNADGSLTDSGIAVASACKKYSTTFTSQTSVTVTHNLATTDVLIQVFDGSGVVVVPESATVTDSNTVTLTFGASFTGSVVVIG